MKTLFNRTLSILCAVMLLISAVSTWAAAEEDPATPTDLNPAEEEIIPEETGEGSPVDPEQEPGVKPEGEPGEEGIGSVEVVITKTLTIGQSWDGKMKKTKPAVLKLDVTRPGPVYMLVEGKDVWATVEKSDRQTEAPVRTQTDPETGRMVISWEAEEGSYLITLGPVEPNLLAMATVSFMDKSAYDAWATEQAEKEPEEEPETEPEEPETMPETDAEEAGAVPETESGEKPETESDENSRENDIDKDEGETELQLPEDRSVTIAVSWDDENPTYGSVAHFKATMIGYDNVDYSLQWQWSEDRETWNDVINATGDTYDVVYTPENGSIHWRVMLYIVMPDEES